MQYIELMEHETWISFTSKYHQTRNVNTDIQTCLLTLVYAIIYNFNYKQKP